MQQKRLTLTVKSQATLSQYTVGVIEQLHKLCLVLF